MMPRSRSRSIASSDLRFHLAGLQRPGELQEAVGQRRLAVIDVRDDREVTNVLRVH